MATLVDPRPPGAIASVGTRNRIDSPTWGDQHSCETAGDDMAAWRRRALELFPQLREELQQRDYSIYMLYFDLLPMVREAHNADDTELLSRIYGFAAWCF